MDNVINNLKKGVPFSYTSQVNMMQWRDKQNNPLAKYVVTELAFVGTTITSALEGVAALIASVVVKGLDYVVPKERNFNQRVVTPVLNYRAMTRTALSYSLAALYYNVTAKTPDLECRTKRAVLEFNDKLSTKYENVCTELDHAYNTVCAQFKNKKTSS